MSAPGLAEVLRACRIVPVATIEDPADGPRLVGALMAGGIPCVEITFRHAAAADAIRAARDVEGVLIGAGTILAPEQAAEALEAGADFAVAPGTNEAVIAGCREMGLPFVPGVATPSEIERARGLGLRLLKAFPASQIGGPGFLRAVSATYPDVEFLPTGGISEENLADYLAVPSVAACAGGWLVRDELIRAGRFDEIERLARAAVEIAG
jgi:2-dehydro-3-deoxyphosphogluconate aldolase/(4S)-4-hydroxy-2-oxoglutarate aldolase